MRRGLHCGRWTRPVALACLATSTAAITVAAEARALRLPRTAVVSVNDNAFHRGVDRPVVRVRAGGTVTWRWRSRQSHQVTVTRGPQRFRSPTRSGGGTFSVRLRRRGSYRIVCPIHAPGMRMTVVVR
jgi:plastocyanin